MVLHLVILINRSVSFHLGKEIAAYRHDKRMCFPGGIIAVFVGTIILCFTGGLIAVFVGTIISISSSFASALGKKFFFLSFFLFFFFWGGDSF